MHSPDPDELLRLAEAIAAEAAALLRAGQLHARAEVDTKSSLTDMVTEIDRASERLVVDAIRSARPGDGILGEEGTAIEGTTGVRWVVDPLDGTTNYLYGLPAFAVSIGVEVDGVAVAGVVADAARGESFTAIRGGGARRDGIPIACSAADRLATALVGTGFGYDSGRRARQGQVLAAVLPLVRDVRRVGAAAIDLCWVACGRLDAYYETGPQPWDTAAGGLIASEAGAVVGDLRGGPAGHCTLAAAPRLFEPLRALLSGLDADRV